VKRVSVSVKFWKPYPILLAILILLILLCSITGVVAFLELIHGVGAASKMTASAPTGRQSQSPIGLNPSCLDASQVQQGEKLFLEIRDRSPAVLQVKSGRGSRGATAALIIPRSVWNRLSKPDQVNLTFFAESLGSVLDLCIS